MYAAYMSRGAGGGAERAKEVRWNVSFVLLSAAARYSRWLHDSHTRTLYRTVEGGYRYVEMPSAQLIISTGIRPEACVGGAHSKE